MSEREPWMEEPFTPTEAEDVRRCSLVIKEAKARLQAAVREAERNRALAWVTFKLREQTGIFERINAARKARWSARDSGTGEGG